MKTIELSHLTPHPFNEWNNRKNEIAGQIEIPHDQFPTMRFYANPPEDVVYHGGYFGYLAKAWENHYSVTMAPDNIWFIILNELTAVIAKEPDEYAGLFTRTPGEKQEITVLTGDPETIDPASVIHALRSRVPTKIDDFLPRFSTTTAMATLAMNIAFCDMVSPYYNYSTFMCGIPNVRIEGTDEDWTHLVESIDELAGTFQGKLRSYLSGCSSTVQSIIKATKNNDANFFKRMVKLHQCGSGHQHEIDGWIMQLLYKNQGCRVRMEEVAPHFSNMTYTNLETQRKFKLYAGIFYSKLDSGFMVPCYDAVRYEVLEKDQKPKHGVRQLKEVTGEDILDAIDMAITSEEISGTSRKLKGKWSAESEHGLQQGIVYAPYIPKIKQP